MVSVYVYHLWDGLGWKRALVAEVVEPSSDVVALDERGVDEWLRLLVFDLSC